MYCMSNVSLAAALQALLHLNTNNLLLLLFAVKVDKGTVPPISTVRKFLALLEQSDIDFNEELGNSEHARNIHRNIQHSFNLHVASALQISFLHEAFASLSCLRLGWSHVQVPSSLICSWVK